MSNPMAQSRLSFSETLDLLMSSSTGSDSPSVSTVPSSDAVTAAVKGAAAKAPPKKAKAAKATKVQETYDEEDPIWDDCNDVRRKIRAHLSAGNKVTHFLKEIGGVNSNSYGRFMKLTGPNGGDGNSTYHAAYAFFEKKRIAEGKPKSAKRKRLESGEQSMPGPSRGWVLTLK